MVDGVDFRLGLKSFLSQTPADVLQREEAARQQQQQELARQTQARGLAGKALGAIPGVSGPIRELALLDPAQAKQLLEVSGVQGEKRQAQFKEDIRIAASLAGQNPALARQQVVRNIERNKNLNIPSPLMERFLTELDTDEQAAVQNLSQLNAALNPVAQKGGLASAKTEILEDGSAIQGLPSGEVIVRDPSGQIVEGQARLDVLKQASATKFRRQEKEAGLAVSKAQRIAAAGEREKRVSSLKTELSTRNRNAARSRVRVRGALKVAGQATQGIRGTVKLKLAKLFPDIDVTNEALLDQSLKQLALDELQNFKGPTTDFEFGVTEQIAGAVGDPTTANIARLKSLDRATWFNRREFEQFNQHVKAGGDPDDFAFDFNEKVRTGKGLHSLQDLQDTAVFHNLTIEEVIKRLSK